MCAAPRCDQREQGNDRKTPGGEAAVNGRGRAEERDDGQSVSHSSCSAGTTGDLHLVHTGALDGLAERLDARLATGQKRKEPRDKPQKPFDGLDEAGQAKRLSPKPATRAQ